MSRWIVSQTCHMINEPSWSLFLHQYGLCAEFMDGRLGALTFGSKEAAYSEIEKYVEKQFNMMLTSPGELEIIHVGGEVWLCLEVFRGCHLYKYKVQPVSEDDP